MNEGCGGSTAGTSWRVLILSRHASQAASSRLRTFQYLPSLEASGARVSVSPFFDEHYLKHLYENLGRRRGSDVLWAYARRFRTLMRGLSKYDVVWVEKEVFPYLPGILESWLPKSGVPYVLDYDDATFHTYDQHSRKWIRKALGGKLVSLIRGAASVLAGNSYLEAYAIRAGAKQVVRVPTVVDLARYGPPDSVGREERFGANETRIGWIGTPATTKYLELLREPLSHVSRIQSIRLVTIGASRLENFPFPLEQHAWTQETEGTLLSGLDVGVMPLPDEPWERGKCGYKLIQYMASRLPVIASPVGVNQDIVTADVGYLAETADDWVNALLNLSRNNALRKRLGLNGRLLVEQKYCLSAVAPRVVDVLRDAAFGR